MEKRKPGGSGRGRIGGEENDGRWNAAGEVSAGSRSARQPLGENWMVTLVFTNYLSNLRRPDRRLCPRDPSALVILLLRSPLSSSWPTARYRASSRATALTNAETLHRLWTLSDE